MPNLSNKFLNLDHENQEMELEEPEEATVTVNIGGFAFNQCRITKNPIVHTPVPKRFGSRNVRKLKFMLCVRDCRTVVKIRL